MNWIEHIWHIVIEFLSSHDIGKILTFMGAGAGIFFGIDRWLLSHRKPKASLRFTNGKKKITLDTHYYKKSSSKYYKVPSYDSSQFNRYQELRQEY